MSVLTNTVTIGTELPEIACQFRLEDFKRGDAKTIHTDMEAAQREGLPAPVATGPQVAALIFRQLRMSFGKGWVEGGKCAIRFLRPVYVTDFCVARAKVTELESLEQGTRVHCDVWIENQNGQKVIAGKASGVI